MKRENGIATSITSLHAELRTTIELRQWSEEALVSTFGKYGGWLYRVCRGEDNRAVNSERDRKSLRADDTFESDVTDSSALLEEIERIAEIVAQRLEKRAFAGRTVTLKNKVSWRARSIPI